MPLTTPNFTSTQSIAVPEQLTFVDTSVGSDLGLTSRRITVTLADGSTLVEDGTTTTYEIWPIADAAITLPLLSKSQAANVLVQWMTGNAVTYSKTVLYVFDLADYIFLYRLTQIQTSSPNIVTNLSYYDNKLKMIVNLNDAENAVSLASDIYGSQSSLDRNNYLMQNQSIFF